MSFELVIAFSFSIWIAAILAIIRFTNIRSEFIPFILLIWIAALNETLSYILFKWDQPNVISSNIYSLLESLLLIIFFLKLGAFGKFRRMANVLMIFFIIVWTVDNFIITEFGSKYDSYFIVFYAPPVVMLGVNSINNLIIREKEIVKNPAFLISIALVIYYTYRVIIEVFFIYGLKLSDNVTTKIYDIHSWINLLCNLIYAFAILWMRKKQAYTLQY